MILLVGIIIVVKTCNDPNSLKNMEKQSRNTYEPFRFRLELVFCTDKLYSAFLSHSSKTLNIALIRFTYSKKKFCYKSTFGFSKYNYNRVINSIEICQIRRKHLFF